MVVLTCPWCEEDQPLDPQQLADEFRCERCGTCALLADETEELLELAA